MTKVYVLMSKRIENCHVVIGVFSSKKKVNEAIEWIIANDAYYRNNPNDLYIDTFEMNGERIEK